VADVAPPTDRLVLASPVAKARDIESDPLRYQAVSAFTYKGRIGRVRVLAYGGVAFLLTIPVGIVLSLLSALLPLPHWFVTSMGMIPYIVILTMATIQRSHDMDWSGWMSLLALIPFVGFMWLFKGGTSGENRFGAPPPPNTTGVKVLAFVLPVGVIIGIIRTLNAISISIAR
jgi:uncharacterized membrane protein YhaH (DUF805 family)